MRTEEVTSIITIGETEFSYTAIISTEEQTYDYPGSQEIEITEVTFEGDFNPFNFVSNKKIEIAQGERLCDTIANNIDSFTCEDCDIRTAIEEDAMEQTF